MEKYLLRVAAAFTEYLYLFSKIIGNLLVGWVQSHFLRPMFLKWMRTAPEPVSLSQSPLYVRSSTKINHCFKLLWLKEPIFLLSKPQIDSATTLHMFSCPGLKDQINSNLSSWGCVPPAALLEELCSSLRAARKSQGALAG